MDALTEFNGLIMEHNISEDEIHTIASKPPLSGVIRIKWFIIPDTNIYIILDDCEFSTDLFVTTTDVDKDRIINQIERDQRLPVELCK